jgi:alpha-amylase
MYQPLYQIFRSLNTARRSAAVSHPPFLTTPLRPYLPNNHTLILHKAPFVSILTNYGSLDDRIAVPVYIPPQQTGYKPLLPLIDIISGQILSTDPRGGISVPIVRGEPRVLVPLPVHLEEASKEVWEKEIKLDVEVKTPGPSSPASPGSPGIGIHRRTPSLGRVLSWLGSVGGSKNVDL